MKIRTPLLRYIAAFVATCVTLPSSFAQSIVTAPGLAVASPEAPGNTSALPQITVSAKILRQRIRTYISTVSGGAVGSDDYPMLRWRVPICPIVAGLSSHDGQFVFDRLSTDLSSMDIPLGRMGCVPNFYVVATPEPEEILKAWWHRISDLNGGDNTGFVHFIDTRRPVRVWYNARLIGGNGATPGFEGQGIQVLGSCTLPHQELCAALDLKAIIVVIDLTRTIGLDWRQVADYVAMAGATKVNLDAHADGVPTIMSLFSTSGDARPEALSEWDISFIKGLYSTDPMYRHQRVLIAGRMLDDVARLVPGTNDAR
jgi:hypothetical protein